MILALHGQMGSGKDTAYERLTVLFPQVKWERISFADPLKDSFCALFNISRSELEKWKTHHVPFLNTHDGVGRRHKDWHMRELLQRYGTEAHRDIFGENFWVDQALVKVTDPDTWYVVTDCRFENEAKAIADLGGYIVKVGGLELNEETHASEVQLPSGYFDAGIVNNQRNDGFQNLDDQLIRLMAFILSTSDQDLTSLGVSGASSFFLEGYDVELA